VLLLLFDCRASFYFSNAYFTFVITNLQTSDPVVAGATSSVTFPLCWAWTTIWQAYDSAWNAWNGQKTPCEGERAEGKYSRSFLELLVVTNRRQSLPFLFHNKGVVIVLLLTFSSSFFVICVTIILVLHWSAATKKWKGGPLEATDEARNQLQRMLFAC